MVKINLLDISEEKAIFEKGTDLTKTEKPRKEEKEFSLETVDELFETAPTAKQPEPKKIIPREEKKLISEVPKPKPLYTSKESFKTDFDEEESFDSFPNPKRKVLFTAVVVIIIGLVALSAYYFLFMNKEGVTPRVADVTNEQQATESSEVQSTPNVNQEILSLYSKNKAKNSYSLNLAKDLLSTSQNDIGFALMVLDPNQIQFSILADTRNTLNSFQTNLKNKFPKNEIRLVNSEEMIVSGQNKILGDFALTLKEPQSTPPITNYKLVKSGEMQSILRSLAQKYQLNFQYFKKGQQSKAGTFNQTKYYCTLTGNAETLIRFAQEITDTYPAIIFSKVAFNPSNLGVPGKDQMMARITFILNE